MSRVSNLKRREVYGIILPETLDAIFTRRLLAADLLSRDSDRCTRHAARMVRMTLEAVHNELSELIT